ncbi:uncharacterized protein LOC129581523 [Paramacrobiotus metropolitanus]|uniref:uncharacterized protein LOC129581523 n=1 Tax=Paramacrobiotus metropolitanus TaxID=2943436 RepID=UPI00244619E3|nr:uncharacterized protein LOC129581523 [Paramacrobiotus metropolitanus]
MPPSQGRKTTAASAGLASSLRVRKRAKAGATKLQQSTLDEQFGSSSDLRVKKPAGVSSTEKPLLVGGASDNQASASSSLGSSAGSPSKSAQSSGELRVGKSDQSLPKLSAKTKTRGGSADSKRHDMDLLRQFDLDYNFGPCAGISRMQRWNRAQRHEKNPPTTVKRLVETHLDDPDYTEGIWYDTVI